MAPNVALPPLHKGAPVSLSVLSAMSRSDERTEGKTMKRRITGEGHPGHTPSRHAQQSHALSRAPPPMTEERDSDVEVEVRDEGQSLYSCSVSLFQRLRTRLHRFFHANEFHRFISDGVMLFTIAVNIKILAFVCSFK